jgi:asparagine N-glycosylation enzyme membrane subunit Stt3
MINNFPFLQLFIGMFGLFLLKFLREPIDGKKRDFYDYTGIIGAWVAIFIGLVGIVRYMLTIF